MAERMVPYPTQAKLKEMWAELRITQLGGVLYVQGERDEAYFYGNKGLLRSDSVLFILMQIAEQWGDAEAKLLARRLLHVAEKETCNSATSRSSVGN